MASKEELEQQIEDLKSQLETSKVVYYQKPEKLKHFNGSQDIVEWVEDCRLAFGIRFTEADKVKFVLSHLDDSAKREIRLHGEFKSAKDIFDVLFKNFSGPEVYSEAQRNFFDRIQNCGETVRDYSYALSRLMARVKRLKTMGNEDDILRDHFISGLHLF